MYGLFEVLLPKLLMLPGCVVAGLWWCMPMVNQFSSCLLPMLLLPMLLWQLRSVICLPYVRDYVHGCHAWRREIWALWKQWGGFYHVPAWRCSLRVLLVLDNLLSVFRTETQSQYQCYKSSVRTSSEGNIVIYLYCLIA